MSDLPLYKEIIIWSILGSTLACFLLPLCGMLRQKLIPAIPPVPQFPGSSFPHHFAHFYTAFFVLTFAMAAVQDARTPDTTQSAMDMVFSMMVQIALYIPFMVVYFTLPQREVPQSSLLKKTGWVIGALLVIWIASAMLEIGQVNTWISQATDCPPTQDVVQRMLDGSMFEKGLVTFMAVFVAPVTEECCFRGFVYNILKRWNGRWIATLASALLFAVVHGSLLQMLPLTIFGIVQCL